MRAWLDVGGPWQLLGFAAIGALLLPLFPFLVRFIAWMSERAERNLRETDCSMTLRRYGGWIADHPAHGPVGVVRQLDRDSYEARQPDGTLVGRYPAPGAAFLALVRATDRPRRIGAWR